VNNVLSCEVEEAHSGLAFLLNTTFKEGMTELELFEITRGVWHNVPRDESLKFAYAMHNDIVQEVYEIKDWVKAGTQEYQTRNFEGRDISKRWEFIGQKANAEIRNKYVGKSIVKNRSYGCPFVKVGFKNQEGNSAMKSENFSANKISYMVLAHVQTEDGWGASIQGVGTEPIYILEDSSNDRVIAFVGNDFDTAKVFEGEIVSEVLDAYLDSCNVIAEFNELADENIEKSYFMKFMSSTPNC
jgi:hypothetical protein